MKNFSNSLVNARMSEISPYLKDGDRILDIGSGNCLLAQRLRAVGYEVTPIDISDKSAVKNIRPLIYDGRHIPFPDNSFSVSLLITVLHHTSDPAQVLREAIRVSRSIIIMEDLYDGVLQKYLTFIMDSVLNCEFVGHPHSNKTRDEWLAMFHHLGLVVAGQKYHTFWRFFQNGTFYLRKR